MSEAEVPSTVMNPVGSAGAGDDVESAVSLESVTKRLTVLEARDEDSRGVAHAAVANILAQFSEAPTNWHQATIYFLTSTAKEDAPMRKIAPFMYLGGLAMVVMQIGAAYSVISGMVHPSCTSNTHCDRPGFFCYIQPGEERGKCQMCGEMPPLVPYRSKTEKLTAEQVEGDRTNDGKNAPLGLYKDTNLIWDLSYPQQSAGGRAKTPDWFAGWNYTMVESTCSLPIKPFNWDFTKDSSGEYPVITITDRGDIPDEVDLERIYPTSDLIFTHFDAPCVARWCDACVEHEALDHGDGLSILDEETGLTVSIMNKKLLAETSVKGDSICVLVLSDLVELCSENFDWIALVLCSYVVGLQVVGEIKDINLCEISMNRNINELSIFWQYALGFLNRLRSQFFLQPLVGAIPCVVLTQGGSALDICFNTIAILFLTEVDNMSYTFGLGEKKKERVDTHGHVTLSDDEALQLAVTKILCVVATVVGTLFFVNNGATVATLMGSGATVFAFKLSELVTSYKRLSRKEIAVFVLVTLVTFMASMMMLMMTTMLSWYNVR